MLVASVDRSRLPDEDVVRLMTARDRLVSHLQAERAADIAEVAGRMSPDHDYVDEFAALEVGSALHLTTVAASYEVGFARDITDRVPQVGALLAAGGIDVRQARMLADGTSHLERTAARQVIADIADRARQLTTGQVRALLKRRCLEAEPEDTTERFHHAVEQRRVVVTATGDGTADLCLLDLSPDQAVAAQERIDRYARNQPDDGRTMDQRAATPPSTSCAAAVTPRLPAPSTSPSTSVPCSRSPTPPQNSPDGDRSSPTSPARSSTSTVTDGGRQPSSTTTATPTRWRSAADRPPPSNARSEPATEPASSPDAANPPAAATSTTPPAGSTGTRPCNATWVRCAVSTTAPRTKAAGDTAAPPTATTSGPAP